MPENGNGGNGSGPHPLEWLIGFAEALDDADLEGAARTIRGAIGKDGNGGIAKVLNDYLEDHPLNIGELKADLLVDTDLKFRTSVDIGGTPVELISEPVSAEDIVVKVKQDIHPIVGGILIGAIITAFLAPSEA